MTSVLLDMTTQTIQSAEEALLDYQLDLIDSSHSILTNLLDTSTANLIIDTLIEETALHQVGARYIGKGLRRLLYSVIQEGVAAVYGLEEDTIVVANKLLDEYIAKEVIAIYKNQFKY